MESLKKQTYANNANITAICLNRIVYKECCYIHTSLDQKIMNKIPTVVNLSELNIQKISTFYHILTFLGNYCNSGKLSVFKQQHVDL